MIFEVQLPDGRIIEIEGAPNEQAARERVRQFLATSGSPQPSGDQRLPGFFESFGQAARRAAGSGLSGTGAYAEEAGLSDVGASLRGAGEAVSGQVDPNVQQFEGISDFFSSFRQRPGATLRAGAGQALGSTAGSLVGPLAGAGVGAAVGGLPGAGVGALVGGMAQGAAQSTNELEESLMREGIPRERARELATTIGTAIGAAEGGATGLIVRRLLGDTVRREAVDRIAAAAQRGLLRSAVREGGRAAVVEGGSEMLGEGARQAVVGAETGNPDIARRLDQVALEGLLGAFGGGVAGVAGGTRAPAQARAALAERGLGPDGQPLPLPGTPPPRPAPATTADPETSPLPDEPLPFADPAEAQDFIRQNPEFRPPAPLNDDQLLEWANAQRRRVYDQEVSILRANEIGRFIGANDLRAPPPGSESNAPIRDNQAATLITNLVEEARTGALDLTAFTATDITNTALGRLGATAEPTNREIRTVNSTLDALTRLGYLDKNTENDTYSITQRNVDSLRALAERRRTEAARPTRADRRTDASAEFPGLTEQTQEAPPSADTRAASAVLQAIADPNFNVRSEEDQAAFRSDIRALSREVGEILEDVEGLRARNPDVLERFGLDETATDARINQEVANLTDDLTGLATGRARIFGTAGAQPSPQVGLPVTATNVTPTTPTDPNVLMTAIHSARARQNLENPTFLRQLVADAPRTGMSAKRFQTMLQQNGLPQATREDGTTAYKAAMRAGIINNNGMVIPQTATSPRPAPAAPQPTVERSSEVDRDVEIRRRLSAALGMSWLQKPSLENEVQNSTNQFEVGPQPTVETLTEEDLTAGTVERGPTIRTTEPVGQPTTPRSDSQPTTDVQPQTEGHPAFMEPDTSDNVAGFTEPEDQPAAFSQVRELQPGQRLPGLEISEDGSFSYTSEINTPEGEGNVNISGEILEDQNAVWIGSTYATKHVRGRGYGVQAYRNLIDWAHANGYEVWSDAAVSDDATRVYRSLERRGYDVRQAPQAYRADGGWVSYTPETRRNAEPVFKVMATRPDFAQISAQRTSTPQTGLDRDVARQGAEREFRRVLGRNGRLEVRDRIFLRDLPQAIQQEGIRLGMRLDGEVGGVAIGDLAILSLRDGEMPIGQVAIHEGFHIAERMGLIPANDVRFLNTQLDKIYATLNRLDFLPAAYKADRNAMPDSEIRAYGLNARIAARADFGIVNRIYDRVTNFLERIGNFVRGHGFRTWRDLYDSFYGGDFANATPTNSNYQMGSNFVGDPQQTQTPAFRQWFGNSAVVDANGQPLVVYHGSQNDIETFQSRGTTTWGAEAAGIYFTPSPTAAGAYATGARGRPSPGGTPAIYPAYLRIQKPKFVDRSTVSLVTPGEQAKYMAAGYDGLIYRDSANPDLNEYVVFNPTQIKSAIGNRGTWSDTNPHIGFSGIRLPATTKAAHPVVRQAMANQTNWFTRLFGSPVLTLGKMGGLAGKAADHQQTVYTRTQEATYDFHNLAGEGLSQLDGPSMARVTRVWAEASRTGKPPNMAGLNAAEQKALREFVASGQRMFDFLAESHAINYYTPDAAKDARTRARLESFWERNAGKHLWEISPRELQAASPEGFKVLQDIEKMRNPYYMPVMAQGSHFVAVYKKDTKGNRTGSPLAMIAYNPINLMQKMRRAADPEAAAVAELRRQFPDDRRYYIMERGTQFQNDSIAMQLRQQGDFIAEYLDRLSRVSNKAGQDLIKQMTAQIDKAQMERFFRPNQGILQAITPWNEETYLRDMMPAYALSVAKVAARRYTQDAFARTVKDMAPADRKYFEDLRDYSTSPSEAFGSARSLAFFMFLGGALDTALINMTQLPLMTNKVLMRDGGLRGSAIMGGAFRDVFLAGDLKAFGRNLLTMFRPDIKTDSLIEGLIKRLPAAEAEAVTQAMRQGVFDPVMTNESRGQFTAEFFRNLGSRDPGARAQTANKISNLFSLFMRRAEEINRGTTFLAAYRLATENPQTIERYNNYNNTQLRTPYQYAVATTFDSQYLITKEDRALVQRFHPAAEVATQFMAYPLKTTEVFVRDMMKTLEGIQKGDPEMARAGAVSLLAFIGPLVGMAGIWAIPGAEWLREISEAIASKFFNGTQNFDADLREWMASGIGAANAEAVLRGIPHAAGAVSLSRRLAVNPIPFDEVVNFSPLSLLGPTGGLIENVTNLPAYYRNGDYFSLAAALLPRAIGNIVKGAGVEVTGEQQTLRGNRIITPAMVDNFNDNNFLPAGARIALGFPPPAFVNQREIVTRTEEITRQMRAPQERFNQEAARLLTSMLDARRTGDTQAMGEAHRRFQNFVQRHAAEQRDLPPERQINMSAATMRAIQRRAINDFYGISSEEATSRAPNARARQEIQRQRQLLDWRNQPN